MITPTPAEILTLRAACAKRFGAARMLLVKLAEPIDAAIVVAALDLKSYSTHVDNRQANISTAPGILVVDRLLWCSPVLPAAASAPAGVDSLVPGEGDANPVHTVALERLEALREAWPAVDGKVSAELQIASGTLLGSLSAVPLTPGNTPAAFKPAMVAPASGPGARWLVSHATPGGVALVMRQPLPDVWTAAKATWNDALARQKGLVGAALTFARDHVDHAPEPLDQLLDRQPDVALQLVHPFLEMGGAGAASSASFL